MNAGTFDPSALPEAPEIVIRCEPDYYGASTLIARELGLPGAPISLSSWVHGCDLRPIPRHFFVPHFPNPEQTHLVATQALQDFWRENGYPLSVAAGCPFIYAAPSGHARIPGSVLLMPNHLLAQSEGTHDQAAVWLERMAEALDGFSTVAACIHGGDISHLAPVAERLGITWFPGARHDTLSLPRIRAVFDTFEYVFTNAIGSHVPYAAWSGCKVALTQPYYRINPEHFNKHPQFVRFPELMKNMQYGLPENLMQRFPFLFPEKPADASCQQDWAGKMLGVDCRRSPDELARLLGWRWSAKESAFNAVPYERSAGWLGASNPLPEVAKWQERHAETKTRLKQAESSLKKMQKRQERSETFAKSFSGRLGKALFSIEKRLRGLK